MQVPPLSLCQTKSLLDNCKYVSTIPLACNPSESVRIAQG